MADAAPARGGGGLQRLVLWLVIAALLATVWWLASERNERHYRVVPQGNAVVIERGRFFPTGTTTAPEKMYAPIPLPAGQKPPPEREFDNQNDLDRFLFDLLVGWAKELVKKGDTKAAAELVDRASRLPGLTGGQVTDLNSLKADLAWDESRADIAQAGQTVDAAVRKLELVRVGNGLHAADAAAQQQKLREVRQKLADIAPSAVPQR
jgi:hypothetical protein